MNESKLAERATTMQLLPLSCSCLPSSGAPGQTLPLHRARRRHVTMTQSRDSSERGRERGGREQKRRRKKFSFFENGLCTEAAPTRSVFLFFAFFFKQRGKRALVFSILPLLIPFDIEAHRIDPLSTSHVAENLEKESLIEERTTKTMPRWPFVGSVTSDGRPRSTTETPSPSSPPSAQQLDASEPLNVHSWSDGETHIRVTNPEGFSVKVKEKRHLDTRIFFPSLASSSRPSLFYFSPPLKTFSLRSF